MDTQTKPNIRTKPYIEAACCLKTDNGGAGSQIFCFCSIANTAITLIRRKMSKLPSQGAGECCQPCAEERNSDRRTAKEMAMKQVKRSSARKHYNKNNRSYVSHMADGDFYASE